MKNAYVYLQFTSYLFFYTYNVRIGREIGYSGHVKYFSRSLISAENIYFQIYTVNNCVAKEGEKKIIFLYMHQLLLKFKVLKSILNNLFCIDGYRIIFYFP